ncbi:Nitrate/nitrite transporter [Pseudonocardia sp. Ae406_Ps2]|nr:Nitrate/nitrite transporter [Pseudonocardia sp. Ae406_Ps2]OLM06450.1 Nitrate/nitrite transporter [Pseudonocardia sp. Ae331_Ps2]OLM13187.1 Nitrate/nitrite transporter [Pseudonocardia sp. Ae505_Ps2]OLM23339.1 Nitrate/nitrite transporter [Pseudonocardia sp. Ae706_Ps2]OLM32394.1 Nitrate/nitrite transporter [Pseudonocardia sp. Ae717_Ps2]
MLVSTAVRTATKRLIPLLALAYLLNYIDRVNVGFASLTMNADLGLSAAAYGLGAGLFFVGYFFFEVPSNVILHRVGARIWIARIMVTWGVVASSTAFIQGEIGFYVVRVLLGIAEAGFFPGIILYLTYWFPRVERARIVALFFLAVPLSSVVGGPLSTWLISIGDGALGFDAGWRFMFFVEGIPAVLLGIAVLWLLPDRPTRARWLPTDQAVALEERIAAEDAAAAGQDRGVAAALRDGRVVALSVVYFGIVFGLYVLAFFLPQIVAGFEQQFGADYSLVEVGLITAVPYAIASVTMVLWARRSDRSGERPLHVAVPAVVGAVAIAGALYMDSPLLVMACVTVCAIGVFAAIPPFWSLPNAFLTGAGAAAGIGLINSFGNLSGFVGPFVAGWLKDLTGDSRAGMWVVAVMMLMSAAIAIGFRRTAQRAAAAEAEAAEAAKATDRTVDPRR